jgi:hypothetical protein
VRGAPVRRPGTVGEKHAEKAIPQEERMGEKSRHESHSVDAGALVGPLWFAGWLFTLGFLKLALGKALFALLLWPYYLGVALRLPK